MASPQPPGPAPAAPVPGPRQAPGLPAAPITAPVSTVAPGPPPMIVVDHVTKTIGEKVIVDDLTFDVRQGEIFGFIGPSGSGKTSTIRLLTGTYTPTSGQVWVMGAAPSHPERRVQERLGYMPQLFVLYPNLTVWENLNFVAGLYGLNPFRRGERIKALLQFVELWEARNRLAENVSGGMQRRIELAAALIHNPPILFVDEPTAGIDPVLRGKFWTEFRRLRDEGRTLFVTTQYVGEAEYCDRVGIIRHGRLVAIDTPVGLRRRALRGDVVDINAEGLTPPLVQGLVELPFVHEVEPISRRQIRVHVDNAGQAIPLLLENMQAQGCNVTKIEEYKPSFDDVFIELMQHDAQERGEDLNNVEIT